MKFWKMQGLGNDFVVIEGPRSVSAPEVRTWCDRRLGIGADGVLMVGALDRKRVRMDYWNADGSPAELCGNGLRCVARLAHDRGWVDGPSFTVVTAVGERQAEVGDLVTVQIGLPEPGPRETMEIAGVTVNPVGLGNPHAVVFVDDPASVPVAELGARIGADAGFPAGCNVEFAAVRARDLIELRVWERGVGETLACGTGAAAAAAVAHRLGKVGSRTTVRVPGGDLEVKLDTEGAWLTGPARYVFEGEWHEPV